MTMNEIFVRVPEIANHLVQVACFVSKEKWARDQKLNFLSIKKTHLP